MTAATLRASDVMSTYVVAVRADASIAEAWQTLFSTGSTHLVVIDHARCVGVIDDRTIALEWPSGAFESRRRQANALCHGDPVTIRQSASVQEVAELMTTAGVTAVAVVDVEGRPVGLITAAELVAVLARVT